MPFYYYDIFKYAAKNGYPVVRELKKIPSNILKLIVKTMFDEDKETSKMLKDHLFEGKKPRSNDFHGNRTFFSIANVWLLLQAEEENAEELNKKEHAITLFDEYVEAGINYMKMLYQLERLQITFETLNDHEHKFFIAMYLYSEAIQKRNIKGAFKYYKKAAEVYPFMSKFLDIRMADVHIQVGNIYSDQGYKIDAVEMYEEALLRTESESKQEEIIKSIEILEQEQIADEITN